MKKEREQSLPEARKEGLVVQHLSDEVLVYDQQRHKAHCLNETAALVWMRCDGKTTVVSMAQELRTDRHASGRRGGVAGVGSTGQEPAVARPARSKAAEGVSRREMIKGQVLRQQ